MASIKKHIVVVPFPAFGHIIPMMELAKKISLHHNVTFIVPPNKLKRVERRGLIDPESGVEVFALDDGVTVDYDTEMDPKQFTEALQQTVPVHQDFFSRVPCKADPKSTLLKTPVDVVISDAMFINIIQVCRGRGIPAYMFSCPAACNLTGMLKIDKNTPTCSDENFFTADWTNQNNQSEAVQENWKTYVLEVNQTIPSAKAVLVNSFHELEPTVKEEWAKNPKTGGVPLKFLGPLLSGNDRKSLENVTYTEKEVQEWLSNQEHGSVVYLSYGSMARPVPEQIEEIYKGLVSLKKHFIWSLPLGLHQYLPEGVQDIVDQQFIISDAPFLILPWTPQKTILAHPATAVFISHCGWNSALEGIANSVPFVGWPMFGDQHLNADILVRLGVGVRIPQTGLKAVRIVPASEIAEAVKTVAGWNEDKNSSSFSENVKKIGEKSASAVAKGGSTYNELAEFFNNL